MLTLEGFLSLLQLVFLPLVDYHGIIQFLLQLPYRLLWSPDQLRGFGEFSFEYAVQPRHRIQGSFSRDLFGNWQRLN